MAVFNQIGKYCVTFFIMKYLYLGITLLLLTVGCSKDKNEEPGDLIITVSYYYNQFIGYKPDAGADAHLFENEDVECDNQVDALVGWAYIGEEKYESDYNAEADVNGVIHFYNIPGGAYYLTIKSKGRFTFSDKIVDIPPGGELNLVKNFGYLHEFEEEPW